MKTSNGSFPSTTYAGGMPVIDRGAGLFQPSAAEGFSKSRCVKRAAHSDNNKNSKDNELKKLGR
jgi:hypothetical protein